MSLAALSLLTYVWHYLIARLLYDELLRPLIHGHLPSTGLLCGVGFLIGWWTRGLNRQAHSRRLGSRGQL